MDLRERNKKNNDSIIMQLTKPPIHCLVQNKQCVTIIAFDGLIPKIEAQGLDQYREIHRTGSVKES